MQDRESEEKIKKIIKNLYLCAAGLFCLILSTVSMSYGHLHLNALVFPDFVITLIFAFISSVHVLSAKVQYGGDKSLFSVLPSFLFYGSFYNVVLLPLSGFGLVEWIIVFFILMGKSGLIFEGKREKSKEKNWAEKFLSSSHALFQGVLGTVSLGLVLFMIKVFIFYLFPSNIYIQSFTGNKTARFILALLCITGLVVLLGQLKDSVMQNLGIKKKGEDKKKEGTKVFSKILKAFLSFIKKIFSFLLNLLSANVLMIIIFIAVLVIALISVCTAMTIFNDILDFISPYLEKLTETGRGRIQMSQTYGICQTVSLVCTLFYCLWESLQTEDNKNKSLPSGGEKKLISEKSQGEGAVENKTEELKSLEYSEGVKEKIVLQKEIKSRK